MVQGTGPISPLSISLIIIIIRSFLFQALFSAPPGDDPLALDMGSMGKGQVWINGMSIGRHWPGYKAHGSCDSRCSYAGEYNENKCQSNCGEPSQRW